MKFKLNKRNTVAFIGLIVVAAINCMLAHKTGYEKGLVDGIEWAYGIDYYVQDMIQRKKLRAN